MKFFGFNPTTRSIVMALMAIAALNGCATTLMSDQEKDVYENGNALIRLEVANEFDAQNKSIYDAVGKRFFYDDQFRDSVRSYRQVLATARTSTMGILVRNRYFFIDDRVPTLHKGDIVDALYPYFKGPKALIPPGADDNQFFVKGKGVTIVRLVCRADDTKCKDNEEQKYGKLTGIIIPNPDKEGWPADYSTVKVSPRNVSATP